MGKEILTIDEEPTRAITPDDTTLPGGDGRLGPVGRIRAACREYEAALRRMRQGRGSKIVPEEVLKSGAERREKIRRVLAETSPGKRDELQEEGGLVSKITADERPTRKVA